MGSDCNTSKIKTALKITQALNARKRNVYFIRKGQTGIFLSESGVPIDAVISDFIVDELEHCLDELPKNTDLAIIDGQGSINKIYYLGVT